MGNTPGCRSRFVFGRNTDISTTFEDLWDGGGIYAWYPTVSVAVDCVSTDIRDTAGGEGARSITVEGLDFDFLRIGETINMDGTTPVVLVNNYRRLLKIVAFQAGSNLLNFGSIFCESVATQGGISAGDGVPSDDDAQQMQPGNGSSLLAGWTVPDVETAVLVNGAYQTAKDAAAEVSLFARFNSVSDPAWFMVWIGETYQNSYTFGTATVVAFPARTDIRMGAAEGTVMGQPQTTAITGFFELYFFKD